MASLDTIRDKINYLECQVAKNSITPVLVAEIMRMLAELNDVLSQAVEEKDRELSQALEALEERLRELIDAMRLTDFTVRLLGAPRSVNPKKFKFTLHLFAVWRGREVTGEILPEDIVWTRHTEDEDGTQRTASDQAWNALHKDRAHELTVTQQDVDFVDGKPPAVCIFCCTVTYNEPESGTQKVARVNQGLSY